MDERLREVIGGIPDDAFREHGGAFALLSPFERLRWLQQTALFVWKYKGAARRPDRERSNVTPHAPTADRRP